MAVCSHIKKIKFGQNTEFLNVKTGGTQVLRSKMLRILYTVASVTCTRNMNHIAGEGRVGQSRLLWIGFLKTAMKRWKNRNTFQNISITLCV